MSIRSHSNYVENVPLALLLAGAAELNGANKRSLTKWLAWYFVFRVLHADFGMMKGGGYAVGRPLGYYLGNGWLVGMAWWNWQLVADYWRN